MFFRQNLNQIFKKLINYDQPSLFNIDDFYTEINIKYQTGISRCFENLPFNYSHKDYINHHDYMNYTRCILDYGPQMTNKEKKSGLLLVVDSLCPLGIEITQQLRDQQIDHIDIRGIQHLDINSDAGKEVLKQFHISKSLIVCDSLMSRQFANESNEVISSVKNIKGKVMINLPPVFGHFRCKHTKDELEDLFYQCSIKKVTEKMKKYEKKKGKFVLAKDAANFILNIIKSNDNNEVYELNREIKTYTIKELYNRFYEYCNKNSNDVLIESLMYSCRPFPPQDKKQFTLSIVSTLSNNEEYLKRASIIFDVFDYFLPNYPSLPFEFVLVMVGDKIPTELRIGKNLKNHLRIIKIPLKYYSSLTNKLNITYFPEYIMRNVGIRRSRGEFIASVSSDTIANVQLFDFILHRQFNLHSYVRTYRKLSKDIKSDIIKKMTCFENEMSQYLIDFVEFLDFREVLNSRSSGDFQLAHWRIWKAVNGYIEGDEVFNIDSALGFDIVALIPSPLFMKIFGFNLHIEHKKKSHISKHFKYSKYYKMTRKGYMSANSYRIRNKWGLVHYSKLPKICF